MFEQIAFRYLKFFKYVLKIFIVSLLVFLISVAINTTKNNVLQMISGISLIITISTAVELPILYGLYKITLHKSKK